MSTATEKTLDNFKDIGLTASETPLNLVVRLVEVNVKVEDYGTATHESYPNGSNATAVTISNPQNIGLVPHEVPSDPIAISNFDFDPENHGKKAHAIIGGLIIKLQRPYGRLSTKDCQFVFDIMKALSQIPTVTSAAETSLRIKWILEGIIGQCPTTRKAYAFPEYFKKDAANLLKKVDEDLSVEEAINEATDFSPPPNPTRPTRKRARSPATATRRTARRRTPDMNDPTMKGMMRGISILEGDKRRVYKIADKSIVVDSNVAGHNGLQMGQWWPLRHCALRDGAHGSIMSGIAGSERLGAFSVVVSAGYEGMDEDYGNKVHYSAPSSHKNTHPTDAIITHQAKAMQRSQFIGRSVRLFRTAGGSSAHAPSRGIRYDGLYSVAREILKQN